MFMKWCIHNFRLYLVLYLIVNLITILVSGFHIDFTHILVALWLNCFGFLNYKYVRHHISMKESGTFFLTHVTIVVCFIGQFMPHTLGSTIIVFFCSTFCLLWLVSIKILKIKHEDDISDEQELF